MNNEKQIAQAILDAQKMRKESYTCQDGNRIPEGNKFGGYKLDFEECLIATCKIQGLSPNLWALLNLAMHWHNDIQLWAEDVLADKNILEECQKENAKIKADVKMLNLVGAKRVGEVDEETKDKGCPCNAASTENCAECRDTDNQGDLKNS